ncbi:MAG: energy-coupling factor ABC transporter permease [Clostridia bacterium]
MHMADALVSPAVGGVMIALSGAALAYSIVRSKKDDLIDDKKVPLMGVMSAFIFAAQMINFTIPGTGSSGHIGGGILLAALLGGYPSFICMTAVLLIQSLFFADGGILALGCNIWNMGFYTCFLTYPLIFRPILKKKCTPGRITLASVLSVVVGLQLGAFSVVLETLLSGITELPFGAFVALMQPIHLAIGLVEGLVTAAVLVFVYQARPELIVCASPTENNQPRMSFKKIIIILAVVAVVIGGGLSLAASANPDGLEWAMLGVSGQEELGATGNIYDAAAAAQESTAFMPDYSIKDSDSPAGTSLAGIVGGAILVVVSGGAAFLISRCKKKRKAA